MEQRLDQHFTYKKILLAILPPILVLICTSIYGIVDGIFVANFAGKTSFDGLNLIFPITLAVSGVGYMLASGGCALVSKTLGEGKKELASKYFTMIVIFTCIIGAILSVVGYFIIEPCAYALANFGEDSSQEMIDAAIIYGKITMIGQVSLMLQAVFNNFFIVDGKRGIGLAFTISCGIVNVALDAIFICGFKWGIVGAGIATVIAQCVGGFIPIIYFIKSKTGTIRLCKTNLQFKPLLQTCFNGSSEFISNISAAVIGLLYNIQVLRYAGENGLTAYGTIMYVTFIFLAICIGINIGVTPIIGYHFGAKNTDELKSIKKKCFIIEICLGILMCGVGEAIAYPFCYLYANSSPELLDMAIYGYRLYMTSFVFTGVAMFIPTFFTGLNDGLTSGLISTFRTLISQIITIIVMPILFDMTGLWLAITVSEFLSVVFGIILLVIKKKKYQY